MSNSETAVEAFRAGYSCSQAVSSAFAPGLGLERDPALRISSGFGGGMGRTGQTCGAVSGALMVIGLQYGSVNPQDKAAKEKVYALVREFVEQFRARNGATLCPELLGYDIGTPEGLRAVHEQGLSATVCTLAVRDAAEILERLVVMNSAGRLV
jgi:C_GCAxxG_C_C family probable redox protein